MDLLFGILSNCSSIPALPVSYFEEFLDMVVKIMQDECIAFDSSKYCTPLLKQLREKSRKRTSSDAFRETADALHHLELAPRVKRVVRRPPPLLTIYVRKDTEKAYNALFLEDITAENFKEAVSIRYGLRVGSIKSIALRTKSG